MLCSLCSFLVPALQSQSSTDVDTSPLLASVPRAAPPPPSLRATAISFGVPALGGLLYGYDVGATSGALPSLESRRLSGTVWWDLGAVARGLVVSASLLGALGGSAAAMVGGSRVPRRPEMVAAAACYLVGSLAAASASSAALLVASRAVYGLGIGLAMHVAPAYIAETAPASARGVLISLKEVLVVGGMLLGYAVSALSADAVGGWRVIYGFGALPAAFYLVGAVALVGESPRWLALAGRPRHAVTAALAKARGVPMPPQGQRGPAWLEAEVGALLKAVAEGGADAAPAARQSASGARSIELAAKGQGGFSGTGFGRGQGAAHSGGGAASMGGAQHASSASASVVAPSPSTPPLVANGLSLGLAGGAARPSQAGVAVGTLSASGSLAPPSSSSSRPPTPPPPPGLPPPAPSAPSIKELFSSRYRLPVAAGASLMLFQQITGQPSVLYYAESVFRNAGVGTASAAAQLALLLAGFKVLATCVAVCSVDRFGRRPLLLGGAAALGLALVGLSANASGAGEAFFARVCPAVPGAPPPRCRARADLAALLLYVGAYQASFGPLSWLLIGELFPLRVRAQAIALATAVNFGANFAVTALLPTLNETFGIAGVYAGFAALAALAVFALYHLVPETKGKSLEEIEAMWDARA